MATTVVVLAVEGLVGFAAAGTVTAWMRARLGRGMAQQLAD